MDKMKTLIEALRTPTGLDGNPARTRRYPDGRIVKNPTYGTSAKMPTGLRGQQIERQLRQIEGR